MPTRKLAAAFFVLPLSGCWLLDEPPTVTVTGYGEVEVAPDTFTIITSANGRGENPNAAIAAMNRELNALRDELNTLAGLEEFSFRTGSVDLFSLPDPDCAQQFERDADRFCEPTSYLAGVSVFVKASPADQAGNLFSLATEITDQEINLRGFALANPQAYREAAIADAVAAARREAELLAKASGFTLGDAVAVEPAERYDVAYDMSRSDSIGPARRERTPVEAIELNPAPETVRAEVTVTFRLLQQPEQD